MVPHGASNVVPLSSPLQVAIMSHGSDRHGHHGHHDKHAGGSAPRMGGRHAGKLFVLNAVLYLACSAFAGLIIKDYLMTAYTMEILGALVVVPLVMAAISTVVHMKAHRWTSVDDMAERFTK